MIALLCSLMANIHSNGRRFEPADFMPSWGSEPQQPSAEAMIAKFESALTMSRKAAG